MNRDETIALFKRCEAARAAAWEAALAEGKLKHEARGIAHDAATTIWNGWADELLAERETMEADRHWAAEKDFLGNLEPQNNETSDWMARAAADFSRIYFLVRGTEEDTSEAKRIVLPKGEPINTIPVEDSRINFSGFKFPNNAIFENTTFSGDTYFRNATFFGSAFFDNVGFSGDVTFVKAAFSSNAYFSGATVTGDAAFAQTTFSGGADFKSTIFSGDAIFRSAVVTGNAFFSSVDISGDAIFPSVVFSGHAYFGSASFSGNANFQNTRFSRDANFSNVVFSGDTNFESVIFGDTSFRNAAFARRVAFQSVTFSGDADFWLATFSDNALFWEAIFEHRANFPLVRFNQYAEFEEAQFRGPADFNAVRGDRAFTLEDAHFEHVPDFIQAHFEEAPRLDNVRIVARMIPPFPGLEKKKDEKGKDIEPVRWDKARHWAKRKASFPRRLAIGSWQRVRRGWSQSDDLRDMPARWRALKRLAIQAHDQDREHRFFAREIRSARFLYHWPLPIRRLGFRGLLGLARFWAGCAYGVFSNYGRSVPLPAFWWLLGVALAAGFYYAEHRTQLDALNNHRPWGETPVATTSLSWWDSDYWQLRWDFTERWWNDDKGTCLASGRQKADEAAPRADRPPAPRVEVIGLSRELREQTGGVREAVQLALRDGFLILYGDADTAHRTYGCLYGVELYGGGTPVAIVPPDVAFWSAMHKLWSAVMIFLFGLALRNMLKMK